MKKRNPFSFLLITVLFIQSTANCSSAPAEVQDESQELDTTEVDDQLETPQVTNLQIPTPVAPLEREYQPAEDNITKVVVDGDKDDWTPYPAALFDPVGDNTGEIDVTYAYAFTNEEYLYILFEVEGQIGSYVQMDVDINNPDDGGLPDYMINVRPYNNNIPSIHRIQDQEFIEIGDMGAVYQKNAIEIRIPLDAFEGPAPETVSLRVMDGVCCGEDWNASESTASFPILQTNEMEATFDMLADLTSENSAFCRDTSLQSETAFLPAADIVVPDGYSALYFIPPSGLNVPSDVVVASNGDVLVASSRMGKVQKVLADGSVMDFVDAHTYALDQDDQGNLYGYMFPSGEVFRISPQGETTPIVRLTDTACESTLAAAPDGTLYLGTNFCSGETSGETVIYRIPEGSSTIEEILGGLDTSISSLDVDSSGQLYAVIGNSLEAIDVDSGERETIAKLPEWGSFHALVVDDTGTAFVATGEMGSSGDLYRIGRDGSIDLIAAFEDSGLEGLALTPDGKIIGAQRTISGLKIIDQNGTFQDLVKPNGMVSPHTIVVSPCGEAITVNDEAGALTIASPAGDNSTLIKLNSFQPPQTFLAFAPQGWYITGESAPGFPSFLKRYLPDGLSEILADDISEVSGVAVGRDGAIYASATGSGQIIKIGSDGTRQVIADGLSFPQALAVRADNSLLVAVGGRGDSEVFSMPQFGDSIVAVSPDGSVNKLADINAAADIAVGNNGSIYIASERIIQRITPQGELETFAEGFGWVRGVAFDAAGNLLVADDQNNAVVIISGFPKGSLIAEVTEDGSGEAVDAAHIRVTQSEPPFAGALTSTGDKGEFIVQLAEGTYTLTVWKDGYVQEQIENIVIHNNEETTLKISLNK